MSHDEQILQALAEARAELDDGLLAFYEQLQRAIVQKKQALTLPAAQLLQAGDATELARQGKPHLAFDALALEAEPFHGWLLEMAHLFEQNDPGALDEMEGIDPAQSVQLARAWFQQGSSGHGPTLDALLANALAPFLELAAERLLPLLPLHLWDEAYCPVCGGQPDFALWGETESTQLICERCRAVWGARVVGCLFCGETEPSARGVYSTEDERYLIEVCDSCGNYMKGINEEALAPGEEPLLAAERLLTPGLDLLAIQEGYDRPEGRGVAE